MRWALLLAVVAACGRSILTPAEGPNTDYPCGVRGVECGGGMCCWEGDVCGGVDRRCPVGACCYEGPDEAAAARYQQWSSRHDQ